MKRFAVVSLCLLVAAVALGQQVQVQVQGGVCTIGSARISFLAPDLVRLEWSQGKKFADWPSADVVKRDWPAVRVKVQTAGGLVTLATSQLTVRYRTPARFSHDNLTITSPSFRGEWHPGDQDPGNLRGTTHSLDGANESNLPKPGLGLLSRSGWFAYDDTGRPLINPATNWLAKRQDPAETDMYFCAYGKDYRRSLALGSDLFGHVYMPPKYAFGAWYSRYWPYTSAQERAIVEKFRSSNIPLDVLVIDVDWHPNGWESYDWNKKLFPDPDGFLKWVHGQGLKVTLNNHPGELPKADSHFDAICKMLGEDPAKKNSIRLNLADQNQAEASFDLLRQPLMKQGINFWWIDGDSAWMNGLNSAQWTSKEYFDYTEKFTGKRGLLFARWGGLGDRYPVGFSGDTYSQWAVLGYEVGFTATAGNVLFPYWSHDIGGFQGNRIPTDLYVRWVEFGALSPILRLHSNHGVREPWNYGAAGMAVAKRYFDLRYALIPYIYSNARRTWETGEPLCKPLYLDWPNDDEAYRHNDEYLFGDAILVAPIVQPAPAGQPATREVWLPPGNWVDFWTGDGHASGTIPYEAGLQRLPMFLRRGSIIVEGPADEYVGQKPDNNMRAIVTVGAKPASFQLYEDDGVSKGYQGSAFATTQLSLKEAANNDTSQTLTIGAAKGHFDGQVARRQWTVEVRGRFAPARVLVDGKAVPHSANGPDDANATRPSWRFDPATMRTYIYLPERPVGDTSTVALEGGGGWKDYSALGEIRDLARSMRSVPGRVANLPGDWTATSQACSSTAAKADALSASLVSGKTPPAEARVALTKLTDQDLPAAADAAAKGAANPESRYQALAAILGVDVHGHLTVSEGGRSARLTPVATASPLAASRKLAASLHGPTGKRAAASAASVSFTDFYPVGTYDLSIPLTGTFDGRPVATTVTATTDASSLQLFHLVGPWGNANHVGVTTAYPPEKNFKLGEAWQGVGGKPVKWLTTNWRWPSGPKPEAQFINLEPLFNPHDNTVAYAVAYVWAPKAVDALALTGSDDEEALFVNGAKVFSYDQPRMAQADHDRIPLKLVSGWNVLMLKNSQEGGQWGFFLKLADPDGKPLRGLWTSLKPEGTPPGK